MQIPFAPTPPEDLDGRYEFVRRLGGGAFGDVYLYHDTDTDRPVAVKLIRGGTKDTVRDEKTKGARLSGHPGIAELYVTGAMADGTPYLVLEFVPGGTLTEHAAQQALSSDARLRLLAAVCDAVQYAQERGIAHLDLKPGNILINAEGHPKVIDFGLARAVDSDGAVEPPPSRGILQCGTPEYMSPEQFGIDPNAVGVRADVHALGVLAYELLAGRRPYELNGRPPDEIGRIIRQEEPVPLHRAVRGVPRDLSTIVHRALAKDPEARYGSAGELGADIRRFLNKEPILARRQSVAYFLATKARRHALITAVVGLAVVMTLVVFGIQERRVHAARELLVGFVLDQVKTIDELIMVPAGAQIENPPAGLRERLLLAQGKLRALLDTGAADRVLPALIHVQRLLGSLHWGAGAMDDARAALIKGLSFLDLDTAPVDPVGWQLERMAFLEIYSGVLNEMGDSDAARQLLDEIDRLAGSLDASGDRGVAIWEARMRSAANRPTLLRATDPRAALAAARDAVAVIEAAPPEIALRRMLLVKVFAEQADLLKQIQPGDATAPATRAVELARELGDPLMLARTLDARGRVARQLGEVETARTALQECLSVLEDSEAQRVPWQALEIEARSRSNLGSIFARADEFEPAIEADDRALRAQERLVARRPGSDADRNQLVLMFFNAALHRKAADRDGYVEHLESALGHADRLNDILRAYDRVLVLFYWAKYFEFEGLGRAVAKLKAAVDVLQSLLDREVTLPPGAEGLVRAARAELAERR